MTEYLDLSEFSTYFSLRNGFIILVLTLIYTYYRKFKNYKIYFEGHYDDKKKRFSKSLPAYTNGWFIIGPSRDIKKGQVVNIDKWGENIALFRGKDGVLYALEAYCAHMGANIAVQGKVKHDNCLQCPFHGWTYSGQTGECVDHNKKPIKGISYQYDSKIGEVGAKVEWSKCEGQDIKLKKYPIREINGYIHIWIHSLPQFAQNPNYQPLDTTWINSYMSQRGEANNSIKCHAQDIAENGADTMHFYYVHKYIHKFIRFVEIIWLAVWRKGDDHDIEQAFRHPKKHIHEWKQDLYKRYIKGNPGAGNIGVLHFDAHVKLPFFGSFYFFTTTALQVGPGIVYIFVKSYFFNILYLQYMQTNSKYNQNLFHQTYVSNWMPYWLSALFTKIEAIQVYNDTLIWDAKTFKTRVTYQKTPGDDSMRKWREWYGQFYQGCLEKEKKRTQYEW